MKMGNRRLKRLDKLGVGAQSKPRLTTDPVNRQEKRTLARYLRKAEKLIEAGTPPIKTKTSS